MLTILAFFVAAAYGTRINPVVVHTRCGESFEVAKTACGQPCKSDVQCGPAKQCYSDLPPCGGQAPGGLEPLGHTLAKALLPGHTFSTSAVVGGPGHGTCNPPPCAVPKPTTPLMPPCAPPCNMPVAHPVGCLSPPCGLCPAGTRNIGHNCMSCSAGSYQSEKGQKECFLCPAGSYSGAQGASNCTKCKANTFAAGAGSVACTSCQKGESSEAGATECTKGAKKKEEGSEAPKGTGGAGGAGTGKAGTGSKPTPATPTREP